MLENIFEKSAIINCVVLTFLTAFTEGFPHELFFFLNFFLEKMNGLEISCRA
jgi:hypothetical protein